MSKMPKPIRERTKDLDRRRFTVVRRTKHWAIVSIETGKVVMTIHANEAAHAGKNQRAAMKRAGVIAC